jgi:hypothetical protein
MAPSKHKYSVQMEGPRGGRRSGLLIEAPDEASALAEAEAFAQHAHAEAVAQHGDRAWPRAHAVAAKRLARCPEMRR